MIWQSHPPPPKVMAPNCPATCPKVTKTMKNQCFSGNRPRFCSRNRYRSGLGEPDHPVSQSNRTIMHGFVPKIYVGPLKVCVNTRFPSVAENLNLSVGGGPPPRSGGDRSKLKIFKIIFRHEKKSFFRRFFSNIKYYIRDVQRAAVRCLTPPMHRVGRV